MTRMIARGEAARRVHSPTITARIGASAHLSRTPAQLFADQMLTYGA